MKIVLLDSYTVNPGDLSWDAIAAQGDLTLYDRTPPEEAAGRIGEAEIVLTNKTPLPARVFEACPGIRYVGVLATGYNVVDVAAATAHGVTVTNIPTYGTAGVAQHTFALLLELCSHVGSHARSVREGAWSACPDFCYWLSPTVHLEGRTLGIIGYGKIGRAVARIAAAFGMRVVAHSPRRSIPPEDGVERVTLTELFARADIISLHCPLTAENRNLIRGETIARMKPGVLLINTARGPLINEADLREALISGRVGGAAADVLCQEPPREPSPLLGAPNCILTPHMAWAAAELRERIIRIAAENLAAWRAGTPQNTVAP